LAVEYAEEYPQGAFFLWKGKLPFKKGITMFSRHLRNSVLSASALLLVVGGVQAQAQTKLRYKFQEGEQLNYVADTKIKMKNDLGGINIVINVNQKTEMSWKFGKVNSDGSAVVTLKIDRMVMDIDAPPPIGGVTIDSKDEKDSDNILAQQFSKIIRKMAGKEIVATMSPTGDFTDVKYPKDLEKELKDLTQGLGIGGGGGLEQFTGGGVILPKEAIEKGKTWDHKAEMKLPAGAANVDTKYTYEGPMGDFEKILVKPKMTIDGAKAGFTMKTNEEKSKGYVLFDNKLGRIAESQVTQAMQMTVEMMGLAINMDMDLTSTLKLKKSK